MKNIQIFFYLAFLSLCILCSQINSTSLNSISVSQSGEEFTEIIDYDNLEREEVFDDEKENLSIQSDDSNKNTIFEDISVEFSEKFSELSTKENVQNIGDLVSDIIESGVPEEDVLKGLLEADTDFKDVDLLGSFTEGALDALPVDLDPQTNQPTDDQVQNIISDAINAESESEVVDVLISVTEGALSSELADNNLDSVVAGLVEAVFSSDSRVDDKELVSSITQGALKSNLDNDDSTAILTNIVNSVVNTDTELTDVEVVVSVVEGSMANPESSSRISELVTALFDSDTDLDIEETVLAVVVTTSKYNQISASETVKAIVVGASSSESGISTADVIKAMISQNISDSDLIDGLIKAGFSKDDAVKILSENNKKI